MSEIQSPKQPDPVSFRPSYEVLEALDKAARDDLRPRTQMVNKILTLWLREQGYLKSDTVVKAQ